MDLELVNFTIDGPQKFMSNYPDFAAYRRRMEDRARIERNPPPPPRDHEADRERLRQIIRDNEARRKLREQHAEKVEVQEALRPPGEDPWAPVPRGFATIPATENVAQRAAVEARSTNRMSEATLARLREKQLKREQEAADRIARERNRTAPFWKPPEHKASWYNPFKLSAKFVDSPEFETAGTMFGNHDIATSSGSDVRRPYSSSGYGSFGSFYGTTDDRVKSLAAQCMELDTTLKVLHEKIDQYDTAVKVKFPESITALGELKRRLKDFEETFLIWRNPAPRFSNPFSLPRWDLNRTPVATPTTASSPNQYQSTNTRQPKPMNPTDGLSRRGPRFPALASSADWTNRLGYVAARLRAKLVSNSGFIFAFLLLILIIWMLFMYAVNLIREEDRKFKEMMGYTTDDDLFRYFPLPGILQVPKIIARTVCEIIMYHTGG